LAINSLFLTGIGLLFKDLAINSPWNLYLSIPLMIAGVAVSLWWKQLIYKYKELVRFRIKMLRKMEDEMPHSVKMYHLEDELYPVDSDGNPIKGKGLNLSDIERKIPQLFIILYIFFGFVSLLFLLGVKFPR
jgi:hypothetical protein